MLRARIRSFGYALKGIRQVVASQPNARIHIAAAVAALGMGAYFGIERWEWCVVILCIGLVLAAEAFNTALEHLTDLVSPEHHPLAGKAKDAAAAAVLFCALAAAAAGVAVFGGYFRG